MIMLKQKCLQLSNGNTVDYFSLAIFYYYYFFFTVVGRGPRPSAPFHMLKVSALPSNFLLGGHEGSKKVSRKVISHLMLMIKKVQKRPFQPLCCLNG